MNFQLIEEEGFKYIETGGEGTPLVLLHGLFGALSNFEPLVDHFSHKHNVVIPILPIYELPIFQVSVSGLVEFLEKFVEFKGYGKVHLLGNSLGGHVGLLYAIGNPEHIASITLTGSSGLYESAFGTAFPKRGDYEYIKTKTAATFYDPATASKELVDEVFSIVNDRGKAIRISKETGVMEIVAEGFRTPNGVGIGVDNAAQGDCTSGYCQTSAGYTCTCNCTSDRNCSTCMSSGIDIGTAKHITTCDIASHTHRSACMSCSIDIGTA